MKINKTNYAKNILVYSECNKKGKVILIQAVEALKIARG
jgi:hypothetical protein